MRVPRLLLIFFGVCVTTTFLECFAVGGTHSSGIQGFGSSPTQCLPPVGKCPHLDRLAVRDCIDIRKPYILPLTAAVRPNPGMNKHDDPIAGSNKLLRFAAYFGPSCP